MINCNLEKDTQSYKETRLKGTFILHSKSSSYVLTDVEQTNILNKHTPFDIYHILIFFSFIRHFTDEYVKLRLRSGYDLCPRRQWGCLVR